MLDNKELLKKFCKIYHIDLFLYTFGYDYSFLTKYVILKYKGRTGWFEEKKFSQAKSTLSYEICYEKIIDLIIDSDILYFENNHMFTSDYIIDIRNISSREELQLYIDMLGG